MKSYSIKPVDAIHNKSEDENGKQRDIPVVIIADPDPAGLVILEKYTKGIFSLDGTVAWAGLFPSEVKAVLEEDTQSAKCKAICENSKKSSHGRKSLGDADGGFIKYLERTELFKRNDFAEQLEIVKTFYKKNKTYQCNALVKFEDEAKKYIEIIKNIAEGKQSERVIYIGKRDC